jgi:DnaJ like chaperone protein
MSYWGKLIGTMAGLAVGGPFGAVIGAALGHAADSGVLPKLGAGADGEPRLGGAWTPPWAPAKLASMLGRREQLFSIAVVVLAAKLAKYDGPVTRQEIDAFKRAFRLPPEGVQDIGRLFDQARDSSDSFEPYAAQLGEAFADSPGVLEDVLNALFSIARADGPINPRELEFLQTVHARFGLDRMAWDQAARAPRPRNWVEEAQNDAYAVLGTTRAATDEELRATWKRLMRDHHPDSLASRGVSPEFVARASAKVAAINAAWDEIKRERSL